MSAFHHRQKTMRHFLIALAAPLLLALLPGLSACSPTSTEEAPPIASANLLLQGHKLYGEVFLHPPTLDRLHRLLTAGNSLVAIYRFRVWRNRKWMLPDHQLADVTIHRRAQLHLITERYEIGTPSGPMYYTSDAQEALAFLGKPTFVPLNLKDNGELRPVAPHRSHDLEVRFRLELEGVSKVFRLLDELVYFWKPVDAIYRTHYDRL
ncbi:MAG: DUF4390 domain-containing protein [Magnetococcales bacterium]|nr:DUF4390 domain-containing protein [Magnetococcales bacterium]